MNSEVERIWKERSSHLTGGTVQTTEILLGEVVSIQGLEPRTSEYVCEFYRYAKLP
jgi:hypothetical protein